MRARAFSFLSTGMKMMDYDISAQVRARRHEIGGAAARSTVAAMIAGLFAGSTLLTPLYVIYKQQFLFSQITLTLIYAIYVIGNLAALILVGRLSDIFGRGRIALPAIAVTAIGALMFLFAENTVSLYAGRVLSGLGIGIGAGTGTAWLAELIPREDKSQATVIASSANYVGLAIGSLVSGLLAQFSPWPLRLPFIVYLVVLGAIAVLVWRTRETVSQVIDEKQPSLRPRLSVPREIRARFIAPGVTGFGVMALTGFYAALVPTILAQHLHESSHAVAGALVFELGIVVSASILATQHLPSRTAMLAALALMIPSVILVVSAQLLGSMIIMIIATIVCGIAAGPGYRGSLQVVNEIAPEDRRAEVVSSYFVCGFCGNALPVIGIGVLSTLANPMLASVAFAVIIIVFALIAYSFGLKYTR